LKILLQILRPTQENNSAPRKIILPRYSWALAIGQ
jgi:hypothetical protein